MVPARGGAPGDVLFALTTSGRSPNILAAVAAAKAKGMAVVGFTGAAGGELVALCDLCLRVPASSTPMIQEAHEVAGHTICAMIERRMFPRA